jgi:hypothetical protein
MMVVVIVVMMVTGVMVVPVVVRHKRKAKSAAHRLATGFETPSSIGNGTRSARSVRI